MRKILIRMFTVALVAGSLGGCATNEEAGALAGAVVGGLLGSQIGEGHGRDLATAAGFLVGAVVGAGIGRNMDRTDALHAREVLENNRTGDLSEWDNPDTGAHVAMKPTRTYRTARGQYCREYQTDVDIGGKKERGYGTACRQPDGSWRIMN